MRTQAAKVLTALLLITGISTVTLKAQVTVKSVGSVRHGAATQVTVVFTDPVDPVSGATPGNYTFTGGAITVTGASMMTGLPPANSVDIVQNPAPAGRAFDNQCVVLTVTGLAPDATATITIQGVKDTATPPNTIPTTPVTFKDSGYTWAESGTPAIAGKVIAVGTNGFDIFSAGSGQWANYDEVVLVYKPITGDFDFKARIEFQDFSSHWARAGVMARESLNVGENAATQATTASRYADVHGNPVQDFNQTAPPAPVFETGNNLWESHIRRSDGGLTASDNTTGGAPPYPNAWVRIQRVGGDIHTFHGSDGVAWDPAADRSDANSDWLDTDGVTPKPLNPTLYVGPGYGPETANIHQSAGQNRMFLYQVRFAPISVPFLRLIDPNPNGVLLFVEDAVSVGVSVDTTSVRLTFDGNSVTPTVSKSGTTTRVGYRAASAFPGGSTHSFGLTFTNTLGEAQSFARNFTIPAYPTVPASYAIASAPTDPGLQAQVYQIDFVRGSEDEIVPFDENTIANAEQQWARGLVDPTTGQPYPNVANSTAQAGPINVDYINWNGAMDAGWPDNDQGLEIGDFQSTNTPPMNILDLPIPGIPGSGSDPDPNNTGRAVDNIVAQVETYLHLAPGGYRMGVNSDDGFKCTVAPGAPNPFGLVLGSFNGGRGSSDTLFDFVVTADGYYPFRLLWWQGNGGANLEWFTVNLLTGEKILINQNDPNAVKAFRTGRGRAYVQSLLPADGFIVARTNAPVTIVLKDDLTTVVPGSITLSIDGAAVTPTINRVVPTTTVTYNAPSGFPLQSKHTGTLVWGENTTPQTMWTNNFTFTVRLLAPHDLPANSFWIEAEDFDSTGTPVPPSVSTMPYDVGVSLPYDGIGATLNVDYFNNDTLDNTDPTTYRSVGDPTTTGRSVDVAGGGTGEMGSNFQIRRPGRYDMTANYKIGWGDNADWYDYTRNIPAGLYTAFVALSDGGDAIGTPNAMGGTLSIVTNGVGTANQALKNVGTFNGPSSGAWSYNNLVPLYAPDGSQGVFKITSPTTTLRFSLRNGDYDWFTLVPVTGIPPKVVAASPLPNTATPAASAVPRDVKVRLTIEDFNSALVTSLAKLFFDGNDVTSTASIVKNADITTVLYDPGVLAGGPHSYEFRFTDNGTPPVAQTNKATFTVSPAIGTPGQFLIEAEDFDNGGGQTVAAASTMPYRGGAYANLGAVLGVDYNDSDPANSFPYRPALTNKVNGADANVNMDQQTDAGTLDVVRADSWTMTANFKIGWAGDGNWYNYTRTFPANTYGVWAALSHDPTDGLRGSLSLVTGGAGTPNQTTVTLGTFTAPTSGAWGDDNLVQMQDSGGNALAVSLSGVQTLRFNPSSGDYDYLLFTPTTAPPSKWITSVGVTGPNITIKWIGGGTLQSTPSLPATTWTDLGTGGTFTGPVGPGAKFYRAGP